MSIAAQVSRVEVRPRGSSLVADVAAGATQVTVADPTLFGAADRVQVGDDVRDYTLRTLSDAPPDVDGNPQQYATLTLSSGLSSALIMGTPVVLWSGDAASGQRLSDVVLWVDQFTPEAQPVPVIVPSAERDRWTRYEGIVDPPIPGTLSDDQQTFTADPGYQPLIDGTLIDPTTLPDTGSGEPTTAPASSPTPDPYQDSGAVAVRWDAPSDPYTHVRMFLALATTNSDGSGSVDTSVSPGVSNLYAGDVQPILKMSTLTLGGDPLDPKLHYQVALGAWNEVGDAPVSGWVLCQPAFIAGVLVADEVIARAITGAGISIASAVAGTYNQPFSGSSIPSGWTLRPNPSSPDLQVSVTTAEAPSGADGGVLRFKPSLTDKVIRNAQLTSANMVGDFELNARFQWTGGVEGNDGTFMWIGARALSTDPDPTNKDGGLGLLVRARNNGFKATGPNSAALASGNIVGNVDSYGSIKNDVWYRLYLACRSGQVEAMVWSENVAMPTPAKSSTVLSFDPGYIFARVQTYRFTDSQSTPATVHIDYINVTGFSTGFQVLPDATGDWPQVLDPIRAKNTAQDARLTTNEQNIAANSTAITALGNRTTAVEGRFTGLDVATGWQNATLSNGWAAQDSGNTPQYRLNGFGRVELRGLLKSGTPGTTAFTLPSGYRPSRTIRPSCYVHPSLAGQVTTGADGTVQPGGQSNFSYYSLDGISFPLA